MRESKMSLYEKYVKRAIDIVLSGGAIIVLSPVMLITALLVRKKLGKPVLFCQIRPGKNNQLFRMYKFRSMTDEKDSEGNLLPDEIRLTLFGKKLRETSLDELPELFNILKGDMSIVGPRPQLVRDMVFMTEEQKQRHIVRPGLTGLAQVRGRNAISWDGKLAIDLEYVENISFWNDIKIIFATVGKVLKKEGISEEGMATAADYGDYLLSEGRVSKEVYIQNQMIAKDMLNFFMK